MRSVYLRHKTIECSRGILQPMRHNKPLAERTAQKIDPIQRNIALSYEQLMITVELTESTVHCTSYYVVLKNIFYRDCFLSRDGGSINFTASMDNAPLSIGISDTRCRCRKSSFALTYHSCRMLFTKWIVNAPLCPFGKGHCRVTQYLVPGITSISWRTPYQDVRQTVILDTPRLKSSLPKNKMKQEDS